MRGPSSLRSCAFTLALDTYKTEEFIWGVLNLRSWGEQNKTKQKTRTKKPRRSPEMREENWNEAVITREWALVQAYNWRYRSWPTIGKLEPWQVRPCRLMWKEGYCQAFHMEINELDSSLPRHSHSWWIKDLNVKSKTLNLVEKCIVKDVMTLRYWKIYLKRPLKTMIEMIKKIDSIKNEKFYFPVPSYLEFCCNLVSAKCILCLRFGTELCGKRRWIWCIHFGDKVYSRSIKDPN